MVAVGIGAHGSGGEGDTEGATGGKTIVRLLDAKMEIERNPSAHFL